mmetsp:Transcript_2868/g.9729  ORF Transcript_2868/g.9729 Transcript_2868/m.9729 type:complete len:224 (-) Transcript_2868:504-1175(-)
MVRQEVIVELLHIRLDDNRHAAHDDDIHEPESVAPPVWSEAEPRALEVVGICGGFAIYLEPLCLAVELANLLADPLAVAPVILAVAAFLTLSKLPSEVQQYVFEVERGHARGLRKRGQVEGCMFLGNEGAPILRLLYQAAPQRPIRRPRGRCPSDLERRDHHVPLRSVAVAPLILESQPPPRTVGVASIEGAPVGKDYRVVHEVRRQACAVVTREPEYVVSAP